MKNLFIENDIDHIFYLKINYEPPKIEVDFDKD